MAREETFINFDVKRAIIDTLIMNPETTLEGLRLLTNGKVDINKKSEGGQIIVQGLKGVRNPKQTLDLLTPPQKTKKPQSQG